MKNFVFGGDTFGVFSCMFGRSRAKILRIARNLPAPIHLRPKRPETESLNDR